MGFRASITAISIAALCSSQLVFSQGDPGGPPRKTSRSNSAPTKASGRFVEWASVLVTADPGCLGKDPWLKAPGGKEPIVLKNGWKALNGAPIIQLASVPTVEPTGGTKMELYIYGYFDNRGLVTGTPEVKLAGKRIVINISEDYAGGPQTPDFVPSLWFERATVPSLPKGAYEVYLHGKRVGRVSSP